MMRLATAIFVVLSSLILLVGGGIVLLQYFAVKEPVYTVAQVQAGLHQQPQRWAGRIILIRGTVDMSIGMMCPSGPCGAMILGPANVPAPSTQVQSIVIAQITYLQHRQPSFPTSLTIGGNEPELLIQLPAPTSALPTPHPHGVLPDAAYGLPFAGPLLERLFPLSTDPIMQVRLTTPRLCTAGGTGACPDGWLVTP